MAERGYVVVKRSLITHNIMTVVAFFREKAAAAAWAENANQWYGPDHPLTPLTVDNVDVLFEPSPFPVQALLKMEQEGATDENIAALFEDLDHG